MKLDTRELQKLMDLHIQAATVSIQLSTFYAQLLARDPESTGEAVGQVQLAQLPLEAAQVQPVSVSVKTEVPTVQDKPPAQSVAVAGIDMSVLGMGKSGSAVNWEALIPHPPFQMFMAEQGFPNPDDKDATELAVDFIIQMSKSKPEMLFYFEYANWFKAKGFWPNETPFGQPLPATAKE